MINKINLGLGLAALMFFSAGIFQLDLERKGTSSEGETLQTLPLKVGDKAPDIEEAGVKGKKMALSSIKGKYVLIDFWASWCGPCRRENPNVVEAYNKYSKAKFKGAKGFEIFSVSLDKTKDAWIKAIEADKLTWKYHVSDLKGWSSAPAKLYGVNSIPNNFLIDPSGKIVAINLRGQNLHMELDKYVSSF